MSRYSTQYTMTASDDQEIHITYNDGMCASILVIEYQDDDTEHVSGIDANEADLNYMIKELTMIRDSIRSVKENRS